MLKEKISAIIEEIMQNKGVKACALISREGIMLGRYTGADINEAWFAAMCATLLASAESAAVIIKIQSPDMVSIRSSDGILCIIGAGDKILLTALLDPIDDLEPVMMVLKEKAEEIGGSF
jgi:uncharacterized protein